MWIINMESESWSWTSWGKTEDEAKQALVDKWTEQTSQFNNMRTFEELNEYYGCEVLHLENSGCEMK